jgi:uncharacterized protein (DUF1501 family)
MELLRQNQLDDRVVFAAHNVFGRTLKKKGRAGRDHWGSHHATVMIGSSIRPGVVGGLEPKSEDFYATPIDSKTGRAAPGGGDIPFAETLASMAKTLGRALGVSGKVLDENVMGGRAVGAALV